VLSAADVGSTIAVVESASNGNGSGIAVSSSATGVIAALPPAAPTISLGSAKVNAKKHTATFSFTGNGDVTSLQCALVHIPAAKHGKKPPTPAPSYATCTSPKSYTHLKAGSYVFYARAVGPGGTSTAASHRFTVS